MKLHGYVLSFLMYSIQNVMSDATASSHVATSPVASTLGYSPVSDTIKHSVINTRVDSTRKNLNGNSDTSDAKHKQDYRKYMNPIHPSRRLGESTTADPSTEKKSLPESVKLELNKMKEALSNVLTKLSDDVLKPFITDYIDKSIQKRDGSASKNAGQDDVDEKATETLTLTRKISPDAIPFLSNSANNHTEQVEKALDPEIMLKAYDDVVARVGSEDNVPAAVFNDMMDKEMAKRSGVPTFRRFASSPHDRRFLGLRPGAEMTRRASIMPRKDPVGKTE